MEHLNIGEHLNAGSAINYINTVIIAKYKIIR